MPALCIAGTGLYLPPALPVRDLAKAAGANTDTYQSWDHAGVALDEDHPSTMGMVALQGALENASLRANDLSFVISTGMSRDYPPSWSLAAEWISQLRASNYCWPLDITSGCMGSLVGLDIAAAYLAAHGGGHAAIVAAERVSYTIDRSDGQKNTLWAHADGAGAVVVSMNRTGRRRADFHGSAYYSKAELNGTVLIKYGGTRNPVAPQGVNPATRVLAAPKDVNLREAYLAGYAEALEAMYARFKQRPKHLICNQISATMVRLIAEVAHVDAGNVIVTGHETGHVGSADLIIGLHRRLLLGNVTEPITLAASTPYVFGAGLLTAPQSANQDAPSGGKAQ